MRARPKLLATLHRLTLAAFAASVVALAPTTAAPAQPAAKEAPEISREYLIKAAILYNFAKFAEWPAGAFSDDKAPLRICVIGEDPFGPALASLAGKTVRDRSLVATPIANVEDAAACHILFVSASEKDRLAEILNAVETLPILTVADMGQFAVAGGIVALKEVEDRSRLEINVDAANKAGVKLSSKILRLADTVSTQTAQVPAR